MSARAFEWVDRDHARHLKERKQRAFMRWMDSEFTDEASWKAFLVARDLLMDHNIQRRDAA